MNRCFSLTPWYAQEDLVKAVNMCIDALNKSGIKADRAELVPDCLLKAIQCSNRTALGSLAFYGLSVLAEGKDGHVKVTPAEISSY